MHDISPTPNITVTIGGHTLWNREGQALLASLPLAPHTAHRRSELQALYQHLDAHGPDPIWWTG